MNVLSIDTATEVCGIGLLIDSSAWFESVRKAGLKHSETVMEGVRTILDDASMEISSVQLVVCSAGPGSFTGLRIGMATAKGIAAGLNIPLVSVPSLDAIAYRLRWASETVVPVLDARKKRLYTAAFRNGEKIREDTDLDLKNLDGFLDDLKPLVLTGPGVEIAIPNCHDPDSFSVDHGNIGWNRAYVELGIERFHTYGPDKHDAGPEYLRKSDAELNLDNR